MRLNILTVSTVLIATSGAIYAQDDVDVRVGPGVGVDTRGGGVRVRVGPLRIHVGEDDDESRRHSDAAISRFLSDRQVMTAPVFSEPRRPLGFIEDIVVDTRNGRIRYAAIAFPDSSKGQQLFAIPLGSMELDRHDDELLWRVDVEPEQLARAPGFPRDEWPNIANRRWAEQIDIYFGVVIKEGDVKTDFGTQRKPLGDVVPLDRASRLLGLPVLDSSSKPYGTVLRLILDRMTGRMRYIAIETDSPDAPSQKKSDVLIVPMALAELVPAKNGNTFVLSTTAARLDVAPRIHLKRALKPGHVDWASEVNAFFNLRSTTDDVSDGGAK